MISKNLGLVNREVDVLLDEIDQIQKMNYSFQKNLSGHGQSQISSLKSQI
jgi:hypothetical protein